jgi:type IX secretion system PorP/SprF family membrane protein
MGTMTLFGQINTEWPNQDYLFFTINPAMTSDVEGISLSLAHGRRWSKIRSSPSQSQVGLQIPFRKQQMAFGAHIFSDKVGPLAGNGVDLSYAYKIKTGKAEKEALSLGLGIRLMQLAFERDHIIAMHEDDPLFDNINYKSFVPPSLNVGVKYSTGEADFYYPVQLVLAASANRFLPFEDQFNAFSIERTLQWHGLVGLNIAANQAILIEPGVFLSKLDKSFLNYAFRIKTSLRSVGWVMTQFSKAGFLTTQLGINLGQSSSSGDVFRLSVGNSWYFGTLSTQLGNSVTFGLSYTRAN